MYFEAIICHSLSSLVIFKAFFIALQFRDLKSKIVNYWRKVSVLNSKFVLI